MVQKKTYLDRKVEGGLGEGEDRDGKEHARQWSLVWAMCIDSVGTGITPPGVDTMLGSPFDCISTFGHHALFCVSLYAAVFVGRETSSPGNEQDRVEYSSLSDVSLPGHPCTVSTFVIDPQF